MHILPTFRRLLIALAATVAVMGTLVAMSAPVQAKSAEISVQQSGIHIINRSAGGGLHLRITFGNGLSSPWVTGGQAMFITPRDEIYQTFRVYIKRHSTGATRQIPGTHVYSPYRGNTVTLTGTWDAPGVSVSS
ncbi:hypothetical protein GCM10022251_53700 [Phytohabitans flavus]|uniref:Uncharacterized protein n=1 Tax=Phytohabitans flavus TaxID=1076124 RepID=A0A6F8XLY1_9ACTN|nr:hypothetical protein Pflav_012440 [Phytohabitans flavus]